MLRRRMKTRLAGQAGFALPAVLIGMMLAGAFTVAALDAASGDVPAARKDQDHKRAFDAAQAGIAWYRFQLTRDPNYWTNCDNVPAVAPGVPAPVNQRWNRVGADPRRWRTLPGVTDASYTLELIPATGQAACSTATPQTSMLQDNTLRIRSTGLVRGKKRAIVATFKRHSFLDYIYYSTYETSDPVTYGPGPDGAAANTSTGCARYKRTGRNTFTYGGNTYTCNEIQFTSGDTVAGPLHTNDQLLTCGTPTFGRAGDRIETSDPTLSRVSGCGGTPNIVGTPYPASPTLTMPPSNGTLKALADPTYRFTGKTTLEFNGASVLATNNGVTKTLPLPPPNGVIYVSSGACGQAYQIYQNYDAPDGCGNALVKGTYSAGVTVGSDNDIIINGSLTRNGDAMMGLIANNFVRVYHPVDYSTSGCPNVPLTGTAAMPNPLVIDSAILSVNHSFIVDNYFCGTPKGTLRVNGAIAQVFRGPVGTGSGTTSVSGYLKSYNYDDRFAYKEPPNFIDPIQSEWRMVRATESQPAK